MKICNKLTNLVLLTLLAQVICDISAFASDITVPKGLHIESVFENTLGPSVGKIRSVDGNAVIIHSGTLKGYHLKTDIPVVQGDILLAFQQAKVQVEFIDGTLVSLVSGSKATINKCVYSQNEKVREICLTMTVGKAKFDVKAYDDYKLSLFVVKTPSTILYSNSSSFIVTILGNESKIMSLDSNGLTAYSLVELDTDPAVLAENESISVNENVFLYESDTISSQQLQQLTELFKMPDVSVSEKSQVSDWIVIPDNVIQTPAYPEETDAIQKRMDINMFPPLEHADMIVLYSEESHENYAREAFSQLIPLPTLP